MQGYERASEYIGQDYVDTSTAREMEQKVLKTFSDWPETLSPRFVILFSEITAIEGAARAAYDHRDLTKDDLVAYLGRSASFLNSFRHR